MRELVFETEYGVLVPAVTAEQMLEVDRLATETFHLGILQMMENAGRNLAHNVIELIFEYEAAVVVLAGSGGNGGGGICCARHLHNRGIKTHIVLSRSMEELGEAARHQMKILQTAGVQPVQLSDVEEVIQGAGLVVDALIGYSLRGAPYGLTADLIQSCNQHAARVVSLDVPSGMDATTGEAPGVVIQPDRTLTLALPKTGLKELQSVLYLADIGIPPELYHRLGKSFESPFLDRDWVRLDAVT
ncbi:MAG: NAD(P)H-hydrate epimerase [Anaerolineaceae bacterium]|nr:MAG: NAD(P)H-hydrate epimerase [Anaerolineaceae bacterium]